MRRPASIAAAAAVAALVAIGLASASDGAAATPAAVGAIDLRSIDDVFERMRTAHVITLSAFSLSARSLVVERLDAAAARGARVAVALDRGFGFYVPANAIAATVLRAHGVRVHVVGGTHSTHIKAAVLDGETFLSDRNWAAADPAESLVIRDTVAGDRILVERAMLGLTGGNDHLWTRKADALGAEARMLRAGHDRVACVASESFGKGTPVYDALLQIAGGNARVRLLVALSEYRRGDSERRAVAALIARGVEVRLGHADEKFAVNGSHVWIGSANATAGLPDQVDFGIVAADAAIAKTLVDRFDAQWRRAQPASR